MSLRPTLLIAVTETVVKRLQWETEMMESKVEVTGSNLPTFSTYYFNKVLTATTQLSLPLLRYFTFIHGNSTHPMLNHREDF